MPGLTRLHTQYQCLLWSQSDVAGHISHFMSVMWKHNAINLKGEGMYRKRSVKVVMPDFIFFKLHLQF